MKYLYPYQMRRYHIIDLIIIIILLFSIPLTHPQTSPDDVEGMYAASGILTARGGMTSHAAVVARGWGKPCICGCTALHVDEERGLLTITLDDGSQKTFREGDFMSLNGQTGEVLEGEQTVAPPAITGDLKKFMDWVDEIRTVDVLANADTPADAAEARKNGANGIGLCRSEHMFFCTRPYQHGASIDFGK